MQNASLLEHDFTYDQEREMSLNNGSGKSLVTLNVWLHHLEVVGMGRWSSKTSDFIFELDQQIANTFATGLRDREVPFIAVPEPLAWINDAGWQRVLVDDTFVTLCTYCDKLPLLLKLPVSHKIAYALKHNPSELLSLGVIKAIGGVDFPPHLPLLNIVKKSAVA